MKDLIVKSSCEIMTILVNENYIISRSGRFVSSEGKPFHPEMFQYCGEKPSLKWDWSPQWLKNKIKIGSWCKFWDEEDEMEPSIGKAHIGILEKVKTVGDYPYICQQNKEGYTHAKTLVGSLKESS